jgi:hypothetical protein
MAQQLGAAPSNQAPAAAAAAAAANGKSQLLAVISKFMKLE